MFLAGGGYRPLETPDYSWMSDAYIVDLTDPDAPRVSILPDMAAERAGHVCGVVGDQV